MYSHTPLTLLLITPSGDPASSPVDIMYLAFFVIGMTLSFLTHVGPALVSDDLPTFGYGIGIGPPGVGVLQTSGNTGLMPPLLLWATPRELANTVTAMLFRSPNSKRVSRARRLAAHDRKRPTPARALSV